MSFSASKTTTRPKIPPKGSEDSELLARIAKWGIKQESYFRLASFRTWQKNELFANGIQWLELDTEAGSRLGISAASPYLRPRRVSDSTWYPMPVQNEIVAPLQNEQSRLLGVGSRPYVRPKGSDPQVEKAARLATDVLRDTLDEINWPETEIELVDDIPLYGTGVIKTEWEIDYSDTVEIPADGVIGCSVCGIAMAGDVAPFAPEDSIEGAFEPEEVEGPEGPEIQFRARMCPTCGGEIGEMLPPQGDDGSFGMDMFNRPLSERVPKGKISAKVISPYNYFPQNLGVGVESNTCTEWFEEHVESLDWISSHYKNGHKVKPERGIELTRWHPIIGGNSRWLGNYSDDDSTLFDNHARVIEFHKAPWVEKNPETGVFELNRGRSIIIANNVVLLDEDYMIESQNSPGTLIPRVQYVSIPWEARKKQVWGISAVELMIPLQEAINSLLSQVQDARHRFGSPKILLREGTNFQYSGQLDSGYPGDTYTWQDPLDGSKPEFFGDKQMEGPHFQELEGYITAINRITGTMDVEIGQAPKNISSASGVMFVGEKASERRRKRIIRLREAKRKVYRHILQLIHEMYREERLYHVRGRNDKWEVKAFQGTDLLGQDDVQLEDEPYFDLKLFKRESVKDALEIGTISADDAISKRKINKEIGVSLDINEETNNQVLTAEEEWLKFINEGKAPVVDVRGDDHQIHFKVHLSSDRLVDYKELEEKARWDDCILALWGWEDELDRYEMMEAQLKADPPGERPEEAPYGPDGVQDPLVVDQLRQIWENKMMMQRKLQSIPKSTEMRILTIWAQKLQQLAQNDQELLMDMMTMARFRAHIEAHFRLAGAQSAAAGQGIPIPAPPGGQETQSGNIPGNPVMAMPGAGSGPGATTSSGEGA